MPVNDEAYIQAMENRITAYLEMHPIMVVAALNVHRRTRAAFNQAKFFDRKCLAEALRRSPLDTSEIFTNSTWYDGISWTSSFALTDNCRKIVHIEHEI